MTQTTLEKRAEKKSTNRYKHTLQTILQHADIELNGTRPWDIQVHDDRFYARVLTGGSKAMGEAYMDGWWDAEKLDEVFYKIIKGRLQKKISIGLSTVISYLGATLENNLSNKGSKKRSFEIGEKHYDTGNDLFSVMLDKRLVYTCAYWKDATNLDEAQEAKLDLVCRKLSLKPGQKVLDIGCGWGSFAKFAAEKYGVHVVGVTVSKEQAELARELCKGLSVEIRLQDYRDVTDQFDHIVSLGMFEHVGAKHYRTYMKVAAKCLKDDGMFLLHTIGANGSGPTDPWIEKYIFPGGQLPSVADIGTSIEGLFVMEDWHNFGPYYDKTLCAWFDNFNTHWDEIKGNYSERFYRMWKYYLLCCAGSFRAREIQLWQVVLSKRGIEGGYTSVR